MSYQHRLGPLKMRVAGHHRVTGFLRLFDESTGPGGERVDDQSDLGAHIQAKVGGDLFIATAAGVKLEAKRADTLHQLELNEVMDVFSRRVITHKDLARFGCVIGGDGVERIP